jgi:post-segregation antitoxin (ccd killing protein)
MGKVDLQVEVDAELLARAAEKGVMLGPALEEGIRAALARDQPDRPIGTVEAARQQRELPETVKQAAARAWAAENAEALEAYARRVEDRGVFGEDIRRW